METVENGYTHAEALIAENKAKNDKILRDKYLKRDKEMRSKLLKSLGKKLKHVRLEKNNDLIKRKIEIVKGDVLVLGGEGIYYYVTDERAIFEFEYNVFRLAFSIKTIKGIASAWHKVYDNIDKPPYRLLWTNEAKRKVAVKKSQGFISDKLLNNNN